MKPFRILPDWRKWKYLMLTWFLLGCACVEPSRGDKVELTFSRYTLENDQLTSLTVNGTVTLTTLDYEIIKIESKGVAGNMDALVFVNNAEGQQLPIIDKLPPFEEMFDGEPTFEGIHGSKSYAFEFRIYMSPCTNNIFRAYVVTKMDPETGARLIDETKIASPWKTLHVRDPEEILYVDGELVDKEQSHIFLEAGWLNADRKITIICEVTGLMNKDPIEIAITSQTQAYSIQHMWNESYFNEKSNVCTFSTQDIVFANFSAKETVYNVICGTRNHYLEFEKDARLNDQLTEEKGLSKSILIFIGILIGLVITAVTWLLEKKCSVFTNIYRKLTGYNKKQGQIDEKSTSLQRNKTGESIQEVKEGESKTGDTEGYELVGDTIDVEKGSEDKPLPTEAPADNSGIGNSRKEEKPDDKSVLLPQKSESDPTDETIAAASKQVEQGKVQEKSSGCSIM